MTDVEHQHLADSLFLTLNLDVDSVEHDQDVDGSVYFSIPNKSADIVGYVPPTYIIGIA